MSELLKSRKRWEKFFRYMCFSMLLLCVVILATLLFHLGSAGLSALDLDFLTRFPSRFPSQAGIKAAIWGSVWLIALTALFSIPIGIFAAIYLEEFGGHGKVGRFIEVNIANLASVPSIIYGLLGLSIFVRGCGFGRSVLSGALTLSLLVLPVVIIATQEAIRAVPQSLRHAAYALGATKWRTVRDQVLPAALPGILTGIILSISRAFGEAAPLVMIGALSFVAFVPEGPMDSFSALPIQIFNWASRPQEAFHARAAGAILVLLGILMLLNGLAVWTRYKSQRRLQF